MNFSFQLIDKRDFVIVVREDQQPEAEWGLKWFSVIPELANCFAVRSHDVIVGVYYLKPYLSGFELGVYVRQSKRRKGILKHLVQLLSDRDLYVEISHHNSMSIEVFKKLGFQTIHENATSVKFVRTASY